MRWETIMYQGYKASFCQNLVTKLRCCFFRKMQKFGSYLIYTLLIAEEEKARTEEDQGKFLQNDNHADELKGENRTKLEAEEKDFHEERKLNENGQ